MPGIWRSHHPTPVHSRSRGLRAISAGIFVALGWLSLAAPQARAGVTLVQHTSKDAGTTSSASLAFPANNAAGNWIGVVIRAGHSGQVLAVSDTRGNTYKQAVQFNQTLDAPNGETLAIYYAENIGGGANTVTVSESLANNTLRFAILEYSGLTTSNSLDVTSAAQGSGTTLNSGTATTTVGGDLILGEVTTASGVTFTAGSGYTIEERVPASPSTKLIAEDAIQAAAGGASVSATLSISDNGGALLAAFKAAGGGTLPPSITSLSPTSGPVGASVTIAGANFGATQGTSTVTFNGVAAVPSSWSATSIVATVPSGATTGPVVVTVGGFASNGTAFTVTPSISGLNPGSGPAFTSVTVSGSNFGASQGTSTVTFGTTVAAPTSWSNSSFVVTAGNLSVGTAGVQVTVGGFTSNIAVFQVTPAITSLNPTSGPPATSVTINGTSFGVTQGTSTVTFNGTAATPTSWGDNGITVPVPSGATSGNVVVTVKGVASNGVIFTVTPPTPDFSPSTTPSSVTVTGGSSASYTENIAGTGGFTGSVALSITGLPAGASAIFNPNPATGASSALTITTSSTTPAGSYVFTVTATSTNPALIHASTATLVVQSAPPPSITSLNPMFGLVGTSVTIAGANFGATQGTSTVTFNGTAATPTSWATTTITVPVPAGATTGNVMVTVGGIASNGVVFTVTLPPSITSLSPTSGPVGSSVFIIGTNFGPPGNNTVTFNGTAATVFGLTGTTISVVVPSGATTGNVVVTVRGVASNGVVFTVTPPPSITSLSPTSGPVGTSVTIAGANFGASQGTSAVTFNGSSATLTSWSTGSIVVPVPTGATTGPVFVTVSGGVSSNGVAFTVTVPQPPSITSLTPTSGSVGTSVTIAGANFGPSQSSSTVAFNGTIGIPTAWSSTSITVPVPSGATTGNVVVTAGGVASNGSNFTVTVPPAPVTLVQHTSKDAGSTSSSALAFKSNNTAGNWIAVVARAGKSGQVFTVSDSLHNTYRTAAQFNVTVDTPNGDTLGIFYAENIAGGANTVTVADTISGSTLRFAILEYSGVAHTNSLDVVVAGQGANAGPNSGSATTSMNGDLLLGAVMTATPATITAGPNYKIEEFVPAEPNTKLIAEDQIQSAAGNASASATLAASDQWGAILAAFKPGSGGITGPTISGLSPTFGPAGTSLTINGSNFGSSQGTSTVSFNGSPAIPSSWSATSIVAPVPAGASTGTVVVTVGGVASNGVTFTVTLPPPSIASLNPSAALAGSGAFTLVVNGINFVPSSVIQWNGNPRTTAFLSSAQLQATITSSDIASAGLAKVAVANPGLGGAVSSAAAFLIGTSGGSNFATYAVSQAAQDIVYDPKNQVFYLSVSGAASNNPNTISVLDPTAAAITSAQPSGSNPNVLAISDDSQFLYAGVDGAASVQRFTLPGLAPDITYALGSGSLGPYLALDLQVAPGAPHTTAVTLGNNGVSPTAQGGVTIFDDATPRAVKATGGGLLFGSIQWGTDATALFAANNESSGFDFYKLSVNSGGVTLNQDFQSVFGAYANRIHFDAGTNLIYADEGHVINPSTGLPVGNFNVAGPMVVDSSLNTVFFLSGGSGSGATIRSFDLTHFTPIGSVTIPSATGALSRLVRWGQNGLAFISRDAHGGGQVFLVGGNFVGAAPAFIQTPPPSPTTPPTPAANAPTVTSLFPSSAIAGSAPIALTVTGTQFDPAAVVQFNGSPLATTFLSSTQLQAAIPASDIFTPGTAIITVANPPATGGSSSGSIFFIGANGGISSAGTSFAAQIVNQASKDIVFDPFDQLFYLSVPNTTSSGNTIAVLDPSTTQIVGAQYAGSNPNVISISDDGQFLYAGIDGSSSVQRFTLPSLATDVRYPLGAGPIVGPYFALDLRVAPGAPRTTAVTSGAFNISPAAIGGISIFDDAALRPTIVHGFGPGGGGGVLYDSLQWGSDATTLYAANDEDSGFDFYALSVNSTGVMLTHDYPNTFSAYGNKIHFDGGTKLIFSDDGHVVNPSTGALVGTFLLTGLPAPIMVPDSNLNVGFFAAKTAGSSVAIYSFNLSTFAPIGSIIIPNVAGTPLRLIRWGQSGLAFNTDAGQIVLVGGNFVH